jgi:capsular polysaccharide export protein
MQKKVPAPRYTSVHAARTERIISYRFNMRPISSSEIRRVLLVHNSPRVGRYFSVLRSGISSVELIGCRVLARLSSAPVPRRTIEEIIDYGMRRKRARPKYGPFRLAVHRSLYAYAARLHYDHVKHKIREYSPDLVGVWGGNAVDAKAVVVAARDASVPCIRFENGFLPNTTQMDLRGVNVESSVPRDPGFYRERGAMPRRAFPDRIEPRAPRRGRRSGPSVSLPDRYVFVPFQVKLDSQILLHSPWIGGMRQLFQVVTEAAERLGAASPALVFKEHPSCPVRYPDLHEAVKGKAGVVFASGNSTDELIRRSAGVITINSTVGTESLLLGKPVLALGNAVYEIPGVAASARSSEEVTEWLCSVSENRAPEAPLRESFLRFLLDDYLIPDRHQDPGPAHLRAVERRLLAAGEWNRAGP